ncbi:glycerol kinase GlpK [Collinsella sp. zg1085]|uniref:FGGY-family carbohydrate kinase n=1 Tax=Collinsella sp. zg1085 TaxID=2844380 RepID=UPI001C0B6E27|nr:glycerol kinase GlpK [Collinsella sp. zg1085]QWT17214.1 glycerol kinase GlpK [Collinsella sp. zg1085]
MAHYILGIDQSTQGTKVLVVDEHGAIVGRASQSHTQLVNELGWVSHDPHEILTQVYAAAHKAIQAAEIDVAKIIGVGISNQRETTLAWDRVSGDALCPAIVWQCSRAEDICRQLEAEHVGLTERIYNQTGLALSPYYPAAKMAWMLKHEPEVQSAAKHQRLCLGTIDAWLVSSLTEGKSFACDYSNASRTQLFDLDTLSFSSELCALFDIKCAYLPEVLDSDACFGETRLGGMLPHAVPIHAVLGDSHAALFAQACFEHGQAKATFGTGSSVMMNVGATRVFSTHGLSSSIAWRMAGETCHVLEGNINYAGAIKTWLRDNLELIASPEEVEQLCYQANPSVHAYVVPAFSGLGAPYWRSDTRAAILGMTRSFGRAELARAADESIAYQVFDVIDAMCADAAMPLTELRADGGPTRDGYLMQLVCNLIEAPVHVAKNDEMSALGVAWACGIAQGLFQRDVIATSGVRARLTPSMTADERAQRLAGWHRAVAAAMAFSDEG